eukprot:scaffold1241_cov32-Prasinocladus_malaysianus.AAC.2
MAVRYLKTSQAGKPADKNAQKGANKRPAEAPAEPSQAENPQKKAKKSPANEASEDEHTSESEEETSASPPPAKRGPKKRQVASRQAASGAQDEAETSGRAKRNGGVIPEGVVIPASGPGEKDLQVMPAEWQLPWRADEKRKDVKHGPFSAEEKGIMRR